MTSKRALAIIAVVAVGITISALAVLYLRGQSTLPEEGQLAVSGLEFNRRNNTLVGVNVTSTSNSTLSIVGARLVKIQSGITVASKQFSPGVRVDPNSQAYVPIGFSLDPEGADYFLYLITDRGTALRCKVSYP